MLHYLILVVTNYILMRAMSREKLPEWMFTYNMAYLSAVHIYFMVTAFGDWTLNPTTFMMPLVCRLSSLGYCYRDGLKKNEDKISVHQRERKITQLPTFFELLSYTFFPGACVVGPFFEFTDYKMFIEKKGRYAEIPYHRREPIKNALNAALFIFCNCFVPIFVQVDFCGSKEFGEYNFLYKNVYYYIAMFANRCKYYSAWYLCDIGISISGLSYNGRGESAKPKWDRILSCNAYNIEAATNPRVMIDAWNHQTAVWLRFYVFDRVKVIPSVAKSSTLITFLVSAFWHGFYPMYYIAFFICSLAVEATRDVYKIRHNFSFVPAPVAFAILHICALQSINVVGILFGLMTLDKVINFLFSIYFFWPLLCLSTTIIVRYTPLGKSLKKKGDSKKGGDKKTTKDKED